VIPTIFVWVRVSSGYATFIVRVPAGWGIPTICGRARTRRAGIDDASAIGEPQIVHSLRAGAQSRYNGPTVNIRYYVAALAAGLLVASARAQPTAPIPDTPFWQETHAAYPLGSAAENDVRALVFDRDGRLWAATAAGVRYLDGKTWQSPPGGAELGQTYALHCDARGTVWVGAWSGLYRATRSGVASDGVRNTAIGALGGNATTIVAAGPHGIWKATLGAGGWKPVAGSWQKAIRAVYPDGDTLWIGTASGLYRTSLRDGAPLPRLGTPQTLLSSNITALTPLPDGRLAIGSSGGIDLYRAAKRVGALSAAQKIPNRQVRAVTIDADGRLWAATALGVARWENGRWRLRHSRRWLQSDDTRAVAIDSEGTAWVATGAGVDAIRRQKLTLAAKADFYLQMLRARHIRPPGLVGPAVLKIPGDLSQSFIEDDDNDGEHTGMYLAMESLRFAVTKDPAARANAKAAFHAMEVLQEATGTPHFIARSVLPIGTAPLHEVDRSFTPEEIADSYRTEPREKIIEKRWVPSADGKWLWKRDASSDEIDGHLFGYATYFFLAADDAEKPRVAALVDRIVGGIVDHGFVLQDIDGKATRWGNWSPESLNGDPNWNEERNGNSVEILSHLGAARAITGKQKYADAACLLIEKHGYEKNMRALRYETPSEQTHINDELLSMVFPNLLTYLVVPELKASALQSLQQWHANCRRDRIPFYDFVYNRFSGKRVPLDGAVANLREWPLDLIEWTVDNREREDVVFDRTPGRDPGRLAQLPPRDEMGICMWDQEPYHAVIGRGGDREDKPTDWLLAYWMGRYYGLLDGPRSR
jgi:hypothetical protein